jgi:hypothetical protein
MARILAKEFSGMTVERTNTVAGLVEKRAEIAGKISHTRGALRQLIIDLDQSMPQSGYSIRTMTLKASARKSLPQRTGRCAEI